MGNNIEKRIAKLERQRRPKTGRDICIQEAVKRIPQEDIDYLLKRTGDKEITAETARNDLLTFVKLIMPEYSIQQHHKLMADNLEAVKQGKQRRLMLTLPPRHGKSTLGSNFFPAWYIGHNPGKAVILATYSDRFAQRFGKYTKAIVNNSVYQEVFPDVSLKRGSESNTNWETTTGSEFIAVGRGGQLTGYGGDLIILDDLIKNMVEAQSEVFKENVRDWYQTVLLSRMEGNASLVFCNTRWSYNDLIGELLDREPEKWKLIKIPALIEEDLEIDGYKFQKGSALWPDKKSRKELLERKEELGLFFQAQWQQEPVQSQGAIIEPSMWNRIKVDDLPRNYIRKIQSWDTAFSESEGSSYSCCTTWLQTDNAFYLVHSYWDRLNFVDLKEVFENLYNQHRPDSVVVENRASGQSLIQELGYKTSIPIISYDPDKSKELRFASITPQFQSGNIYVVEAEWTNKVIEAVANFPKTKLKDLIDSISMAIDFMRSQPKPFRPKAITPEQISINRGRKHKSIFQREREAQGYKH